MTAKEAHTHEIIKEAGMAVQVLTVEKVVEAVLIPDVVASSKREVAAEAPEATSTTATRGQPVAASGEIQVTTKLASLSHTVVEVAIREEPAHARAILLAAILLHTHHNQVVARIPSTKVARNTTTSRHPSSRGIIVPTDYFR